MGRKMTTRLLPLFGFLFLTAYIRSATENVVYTDYIRLVNSYLEDVWSFAPYLHGDILTRIPVNYLERIINVELFQYSTTFDMMLGAAGLTVFPHEADKRHRVLGEALAHHRHAGRAVGGQIPFKNGSRSDAERRADVRRNGNLSAIGYFRM